MVLGHALEQKSKAKHDRVLLHTSDVPDEALACLEKVWILQRVSYVQASQRLFAGEAGRFAGVFTKLHVLGLRRYTKVLMLDLDLAILDCIDELFDLPAPAALRRGANNWAHGTKIDGRHFFRGDEVSEPDWWNWSWGQGAGINAGVMLFEPNAATYQMVLREVRQESHPEHVPGAGPEQDYLSRLFAPYWRHISVKYNYQLHHVLYNLENVTDWLGAPSFSDEWLPTRLTLPVEEINVVHFSGTLKMWDRDYLSSESDLHFAARMLKNNDSERYQKYLAVPLQKMFADAQEQPDSGLLPIAPPPVLEAAPQDASPAGESGQMIIISEISEEKKAQAEAEAEAKKREAPYVKAATDRVIGAALRSATIWRQDLESMLQVHPSLGTLPELIETLGRAAVAKVCLLEPEEAIYWPGQRVEILWHKDQQWYAAVVKEVHPGGSIDAQLSVPGWHGANFKHMMPQNVRRLGRDASEVVDTAESESSTVGTPR